MWKKLSLAILAVVLTTSVANAQVVFKGPTEGKVGRMNIITLAQVDGDDLKIHAFENGKVSSEGDWMLMRNLDNQTVIFLLSDKEGVTYTFVAGVNKGGKTYLSNHAITLPGTTPNPKPGPIVPPVPASDIGGKIKAAYQVSPDSAKLAKLISVLDTASGQNYKSYDDMETVLAATGKRFLAEDDLRPVRDIITAYIVEKAGDDPRRRDVQKVKDIYREVLTILRTL